MSYRIRVDISPLKCPSWDINPNTGEPEGASRHRRVAVNTVYADQARPSDIRLPLLALHRDPRFTAVMKHNPGSVPDRLAGVDAPDI